MFHSFIIFVYKGDKVIMSNNDQTNQPSVIGEVFSASNAVQPIETRTFVSSNVQQPVTPIQIPQGLETDDNGFTSDNTQQPAPPPQEDKSND